MKKYLIVALLSLLINERSYSQNTNDSNFASFNIHDGWSVELPASWKTTTEYNQDFSEIFQAGADNVSKSLGRNGAGNLKNYLFSGKKMLGDTCSVTIAICLLKEPFTQRKINSLTGEETKQYCDFLTRTFAKVIMDNHENPNTRIQVSIRGFNGKTATVTTLDDPSDRISIIVQIPNGLQVLQLNFRLKNLDLWEQIINRIVGSVNIPIS
jgi:hypothetical protein